MRITSSGNVGIGTSSPNVRLDVGYVAGAVAFRVERDANNRLDFYQGGGVSYIDSSAASSQLAFATVGTERMRITSGGNVGIGTTIPTDILHLNRSGAGVYNAIHYTNPNSTADFYVGIGGSATANTSLQNNAYLYNVAASAIVIATSDIERMRISSNGYVGIGTTAPGTNFHVEGPSVAYGQLRIKSTSNSSGESSIHYGRTGQNLEQGWTIGQGVAGIGDSFGFYTGGSSRFNITTSGNVLIGTSTSGSSKLRLVGLPTSAVGLSSGDVYNMAGVLMIA
jgi:hypothetical protein